MLHRHALYRIRERWSDDSRDHSGAGNHCTASHYSLLHDLLGSDLHTRDLGVIHIHAYMVVLVLLLVLLL